MSLIESLRLALSVLWSNRLRSFLTILGNVVAVSSVVAVVAIIHGLNTYVGESLLATGSNVFSIMKFSFTTDNDTWLKQLRRRDITLADAEALSAQMQYALAVVPVAESRQNLKVSREEARGAPLIGVGEGFSELGTIDLAAGRPLTREEVRGRATVAVIGDQVREKLFGAIDPVGRWLRVGRHRFQVVGVLKKKGGGPGQNEDSQVIIPVTTFQKFYGSREGVRLDIRATGVETLQEAQEEAALLLKLRRGLKPWDEPDFGIWTSEMFYQFYKNLTKGIYGLTIGIVAISLLVGGIVIMNIMFVSVTERTREIGIRRAMGAKRRDVMLQFLSESVSLAVVGGLLGVIGGILIAVILRGATPLPTEVRLWSVLVGLLLSSTVGLFFGIYPAMRASHLPPVEALRYEV